MGRVLAWAAVTTYYRQSALKNRHLFLTIQDSEDSRVKELVRALFLVYRWLPSCYVLTQQRA